jgi:hypothetical protein
LMSYNSWLNHLILGHPLSLFPLNFNCYSFFSIPFKAFSLHSQTIVVIYFLFLLTNFGF